MPRWRALRLFHPPPPPRPPPGHMPSPLWSVHPVARPRTNWPTIAIDGTPVARVAAIMEGTARRQNTDDRQAPPTALPPARPPAREPSTPPVPAAAGESVRSPAPPASHIPPLPLPCRPAKAPLTLLARGHKAVRPPPARSLRAPCRSPRRSGCARAPPVALHPRARAKSPAGRRAPRRWPRATPSTRQRREGGARGSPRPRPSRRLWISKDHSPPPPTNCGGEEGVLLAGGRDFVAHAPGGPPPTSTVHLRRDPATRTSPPSLYLTDTRPPTHCVV